MLRGILDRLKGNIHTDVSHKAVSGASLCISGAWHKQKRVKSSTANPGSAFPFDVFQLKFLPVPFSLALCHPCQVEQRRWVMHPSDTLAVQRHTRGDGALNKSLPNPHASTQSKPGSSTSCGLSPGWRISLLHAKEVMPFGCSPKENMDTAATQRAV